MNFTIVSQMPGNKFYIHGKFFIIQYAKDSQKIKKKTKAPRVAGEGV